MLEQKWRHGHFWQFFEIWTSNLLEVNWTYFGPFRPQFWRYGLQICFAHHFHWYFFNHFFSFWAQNLFGGLNQKSAMISICEIHIYMILKVSDKSMKNVGGAAYRGNKRTKNTIFKIRNFHLNYAKMYGIYNIYN